MQASKISWTDFSGGDANVVTGCTPVSAGCAHCYAKAIYGRFGRDFTPTFHRNKLDALHIQRFPEYSPKRGAPHRPMVFVCDTGDLFHEAIAPADILAIWAVMAYRKDVIWQVLTKRPQRMVDVLFGEAGGWYLGGGDYFENVWLGVSVEDQATADERIPLLLDNWTGTTFASVEPMLGPVDLRPYLPCPDCGGSGYVSAIPGEDPVCGCTGHESLDWVICGAESGLRRRPFDPAWAADLWRQCQAAGVPFFSKQTSGLRPGEPLLIDGAMLQEWPR